MFHKIRFTGKVGETAGLIVTTEQARQSISKLSRLFPYSEASKMERLETSRAYKTWDEAFAHDWSK